MNETRNEFYSNVSAAPKRNDRQPFVEIPASLDPHRRRLLINEIIERFPQVYVQIGDTMFEYSDNVNICGAHKIYVMLD